VFSKIGFGDAPPRMLQGACQKNAFVRGGFSGSAQPIRGIRLPAVDLMFSIVCGPSLIDQVCSLRKARSSSGKAGYRHDVVHRRQGTDEGSMGTSL
jgi:hypothetical protein